MITAITFTERKVSRELTTQDPVFIHYLLEGLEMLGRARGLGSVELSSSSALAPSSSSSLPPSLALQQRR